jgi:hypothetical protein
MWWFIGVAFLASPAFANLYCEDGEQSVSIERKGDKYDFRLVKWAAPNSLSWKMHKGPGKPKSIFTAELAIRPPGQYQSPSCEKRKGRPFLMDCTFYSISAPMKAVLTVEGSEEKLSYDASRILLKTETEEVESVDLEGVKSRETLVLTGALFATNAEEGIRFNFETDTKNCSTKKKADGTEEPSEEPSEESLEGKP